MGKKSRIKNSKASNDAETTDESEVEAETTQEKEVRYASISDRLFAMGIDLGLLYFIVVPISYLIFPIIFPDGDIVAQAHAIAYAKQPELRQHSEQVMGFIMDEYPQMFAAIMQQYFTKTAIQLIIMGAFFVPFIRYMGATPGKMLIGIRVVDSITHKNISIAQSIIRFLGYIPSAGIVGLGIIWANFNKRKRGWHDFLADSIVIIDENRWYKRIWDKLLGRN